MFSLDCPQKETGVALSRELSLAGMDQLYRKLIHRNVTSVLPVPPQIASDNRSLPLYIEMLRLAAVPQGTHFVPLTCSAVASTMLVMR